MSQSESSSIESISSPPATLRTPAIEPDARQELLRLAEQLSRRPNVNELVRFLRLRRSHR